MSSQTPSLELLLPFNNLYRFPFHILVSLFSPQLSKPSIKPLPSLNRSKKPSLISPACTTTQLLVQTTKPISISVTCRPYSHQDSIHDSSTISTSTKTKTTCQLSGLEARLQLLKAKLIDDLKRDPPAAQQQKPAWTESHAYVRGVRTNSNHLLLLAIESNVLRANNMTRSSRSRRSCSAKRKDDFIWGRSSSLRNSLKYCNETELL